MRRLWTAALTLAACVALSRCDQPPQRVTRGEIGNHPSEGFIDLPHQGGAVRPRFVVAGWAVDPDGVKTIRVYLDDEMIGSAQPAIARPDVAHIRPTLAAANPTPGWMLEVDAGQRRGFCTIRVETIDGRGALSWFAQTTVTVQPYGLVAK